MKNKNQKIFSIDPGPIKSGFCIYDVQTSKILNFGEISNQELKELVIQNTDCEFAIETIVSYGMAVGKSTFETCFYIGQLQQILLDNQTSYKMISRQEVKLNLCFSPRAKDGNVNQAVKDLFEPTGQNGKKEPCVKGTKKYPGPLYGFSSHSFSALAIALTYLGINSSTITLSYEKRMEIQCQNLKIKNV